MDLFLKIVGGAVIIGGGLLVIVIVYLVWKFRKLLKYVGKSFPTPSTITLAADPDAAWAKKPAAAQALAELVSLGWVRGPAYTIPEMPGFGVVALHHPATGAHGGYYQHEVVGCWADLCADLADGLELTVGNPPQGSEVDTRPGTKKIFRPGESMSALHAILLEEIAGKTVRRQRPEDFVQEFTAAYARDMAWRNAKGGTSEEEFRRIAANHGKALSDEQLKEAFKETKKQEIERWSAEIVESFSKSTSLSVAEWKGYEDRMFILRDSFHPHAFLDYLNDILALEEEEVARYASALDGGVSLTGLLGRIATDTGHTFTKLGSVTEPQPTDIYGVVLAEKPDE